MHFSITLLGNQYICMSAQCPITPSKAGMTLCQSSRLSITAARAGQVMHHITTALMVAVEHCERSSQAPFTAAAGMSLTARQAVANAAKKVRICVASRPGA